MAQMSVHELQTLLDDASGHSLELQAGQLGVASVAELFDDYLPDKKLVVNGAQCDTAKLTATGTIPLGNQNPQALVSFATNQAQTTVTGITVSIGLTEWQLAAPPLAFKATSVAGYLKSPHLILSAGEGSPPGALVTGEIALPFGGGGNHLLSAPLAPAEGTEASLQTLVFAGSPGTTIQELSELTKVIAGASFPAPPVAIAKTVELSLLSFAVDPRYDLLHSTTFSLESQLGFEPVPNLFKVENLTVTFVVQSPSSSPTVYGSLSTTMKVAGEFDIDLAVSLLSSDLVIQGALDPQTPIALHRLVEKFSSELAQAVPRNLEIADLSFGVGLNSGFWTFEIGVDDVWSFEFSPGRSFELQQLSVVLAGEKSGSPNLEIGSRLDLDQVELFLIAAREGENWKFGGGTYGRQAIEFVPLLKSIAAKLGLPEPSNSLTKLSLENVQLEFEHGATGETEFAFETAGQLVVASVQIAAGLDIVVQTGSAPSHKIAGMLAIGVKGSAGIVFKVKVEEKDKGPTLVVSSLEALGEPLGLNLLLEALGFPATVPPGLDIALDEIAALYKAQPAAAPAGSTDSTFLLSAKSNNYGEALLAIEEGPQGTGYYVFVLEPKLQFALSSLPLVGDKIPSSLNLELKRPQLLIAGSSGVSEAQVSELNALIAELAAQVPAGPKQIAPGAISSRAILNLLLEVAGDETSLELTAGSTSAAALADTAPAEAGGHWLNVQKSLGPVFVRRVGFDYDEGEVAALLDASLTAGPIGISLSGMSVRAPLKKPYTPSFNLLGLGISMKAGDLTVDGAFVSMKPKGLADPEWEYGGQLAIEMPSFAISAIGAYGKLKGHPSFFAFAVLDAKLGGPPFFFVEGLAGGFGYNRGLLLPTIDKVAEFPLVAAAAAGQGGPNPFAGKTEPTAALEVMERYLPEQLGESWFAFGVQFSSFELIETFALLTVAFGTDLEIGVVGLSSISVPPRAEEPIGYAQLALEVNFSGSTGLLAVSAQLTPASFVLSRNCHLTGGFAFYKWFDAQPEIEAGDFVVTLGGYHPGFNKPGPYPAVPTVGANWQVCDNLAVKGGVYFALLPSAVMAGGSLEATWSSGNLRAWFSMHSDFLLAWKPFHYQASIGVSLGVSYHLDLLFFSCDLTFHLGASLEIWGPPFGGKAEIDLDVVSFTIRFGHEPEPPAAIPWKEFKESFLPAPPPQGAPGTLCTVQATAGVLHDLTAEKKLATDPDWVVDPETFQLLTASVAPCTSGALVTGDPSSKTNKTVPLDQQLPSGFGVGPVWIEDGKLESQHVITFNKVDGGTADESVEVPAAFFAKQTANLPSAAWSAGISRSLAQNPDIDNVNSAARTIPNLVTGYRITSEPERPKEEPPPVPLAKLRETPDPKQPEFAWSTTAIPTTDSFDQAKAMKELQGTVNAEPAAGSRTAILEELARRKVPVATQADVAKLADDADQVMTSPPILSLLGEAEVVG
jgi:hypothetical protein